MEHILTKLSRRYPQLLFPIVHDISKTTEYKDAVCHGKAYNGTLDFTMSDKDRLICVETPAGVAEALLLYNRNDFEKCACALANRCEPKDIPPSVGAFMISGLINWEKVRQHSSHSENISTMELTLLKLGGCNFNDKIILLSSGWYSGVSSESIGLSDEEWTEKSITIRLYHELTHYICRTLYPGNISVIRDEVFADMIGIVAAFGHYDIRIAKLFLGIDDKGFLESGRIKYYLTNQDPSKVLQEINSWMSLLYQKLEKPVKDINELIVNLFDEIQSYNCCAN